MQLPNNIKIVLLLVITVGVLALSYYISYNKGKRASVSLIPSSSPSTPNLQATSSPTPTITPEVDTSDWKTYEGRIETNYPLNFSLKYPSNWKIKTVSESEEYKRKVLYTNDGFGNEYRLSLGWGGHGIEGVLMRQGEEAINKSEDKVYNNYKAIKNFTFKKSDSELVYILIVFKDYHGAIFEINLLNISRDKRDQDIIEQIDKILNTIAFNIQTQGEIADWQTYQNNNNGIELKYPSSIVTVSNKDKGVLIIHSIDFKHPDPCDFKGDAPPLKKLTDFRVTIEIADKNLKETVIANENNYLTSNFLLDNKLKFEPDFIDEANIGYLNGYRITSGVEGCGEYTYYFPLNSANTLVIKRSFITEFKPVIAEYKKYLELSGIIPPDKEEKLFNQVISTFRFIRKD